MFSNRVNSVSLSRFSHAQQNALPPPPPPPIAYSQSPNMSVLEQLNIAEHAHCIKFITDHFYSVFCKDGGVFHKDNFSKPMNKPIIDFIKGSVVEYYFFQWLDFHKLGFNKNEFEWALIQYAGIVLTTTTVTTAISASVGAFTPAPGVAAWKGAMVGGAIGVVAGGISFVGDAVYDRAYRVYQDSISNKFSHEQISYELSAYKTHGSLPETFKYMRAFSYKQIMRYCFWGSILLKSINEERRFKLTQIPVSIPVDFRHHPSHYFTRLFRQLHAAKKMREHKFRQFLLNEFFPIYDLILKRVERQQNLLFEKFTNKFKAEDDTKDAVINKFITGVRSHILGLNLVTEDYAHFLAQDFVFDYFKSEPAHSEVSLPSSVNGLNSVAASSSSSSSSSSIAAIHSNFMREPGVFSSRGHVYQTIELGEMVCDFGPRLPVSSPRDSGALQSLSLSSPSRHSLVDDSDDESSDELEPLLQQRKTVNRLITVQEHLTPNNSILLQGRVIPEYKKPNGVPSHMPLPNEHVFRSVQQRTKTVREVAPVVNLFSGFKKFGAKYLGNEESINVQKMVTGDFFLAMQMPGYFGKGNFITALRPMVSVWNRFTKLRDYIRNRNYQKILKDFDDKFHLMLILVRDDTTGDEREDLALMVKKPDGSVGFLNEIEDPRILRNYLNRFYCANDYPLIFQMMYRNLIDDMEELEVAILTQEKVCAQANFDHNLLTKFFLDNCLCVFRIVNRLYYVRAFVEFFEHQCTIVQRNVPQYLEAFTREMSFMPHFQPGSGHSVSANELSEIQKRFSDMKQEIENLIREA